MGLGAFGWGVVEAFVDPVLLSSRTIATCGIPMAARQLSSRGITSDRDLVGGVHGRQVLSVLRLLVVGDVDVVEAFVGAEVGAGRAGRRSVRR